MASDDGKKNEKKYERLTVRLPLEYYAKLQYWLAADGFASMNEMWPVLIDLYASIRSGDYRLPTLEQQRLNEMLEEMRALSQNMRVLEQTVNAGFDSLLGLTRGDNYLLEQSNDEEA